MKKTIQAVAILGIALVGLAIFVTPSLRETSTETKMPNATTSSEVFLTVDGLYTDMHVPISASSTVLSILKRLDAKDPKLQLKTTEYSGLGTLVTGMGGIENGEGQKYWQYTVNGTMPEVGADAFVLHGDDTIAWHFGISTF